MVGIQDYSLLASQESNGYSRLMAADEAGTLAQLKRHRKELNADNEAVHEPYLAA